MSGRRRSEHRNLRRRRLVCRRDFKRLASDVARQGIVSSIEQTDLDPADKQALVVQVDRVIDQYRSGKISLEDLARILDELSKSAVMQGIIIATVEAAYVEPSGLSDEEKQAAHLTLQRVLRGMHDDSATNSAKRSTGHCSPRRLLDLRRRQAVCGPRTDRGKTAEKPRKEDPLPQISQLRVFVCLLVEVTGARRTRFRPSPVFAAQCVWTESCE